MNARVRVVVGWLRLPVVESLLATLLAGVFVLLAVESGGAEYEGRVSLLAGPVAPATGAPPQYGEVVALTLPALVELARSPSVLASAAAETGMAPDALAGGVSVELVPASGLARLAVRAPAATQAGAAAAAIARNMIAADLLAPAGRLRLLDERPDVIRVAPDWPLGLGLALVAAVVTAIASVAVRHLFRNRTGAPAVRAALLAAGTHRPVATMRADDPDLPQRLAALCDAAARPARVVAVVPELTEPAEALARRLPDKSAEPADGTAVIAMTHADRHHQDELTAAVAVLPGSAVLVAVVLA